MKLGKLTGYEVKDQEITLDFQGQKAQVKVVTPYIINIFYSIDGTRTASKAIEGEKTVPVTLNVHQEADGLWIDTGEISTRVRDGCYVDFYDRNGLEVCGDYRGEREPLQRVSPEVIKLLEED